jgi:hypothetical protein
VERRSRKRVWNAGDGTTKLLIFTRKGGVQPECSINPAEEVDGGTPSSLDDDRITSILAEAFSQDGWKRNSV